jgi:nucleoside-diphosphate-sugar epimerase
MPQRVLVLGASGFIGQELIRNQLNSYNVFKLDRSSQTFDLQLSQLKPDIVINCSSSKPNASFLESLSANFLFQMKCLNVISSAKISKFKWVQIGSYFELQIAQGRNDFYSIHKELCRRLLSEAASEGIIDLTTIFLPHIFGKGENPNRITPYLKNQFQSGEIAFMTSGQQYLPMLPIEDAVEAVEAAISSIQTVCSASPIWHGKVIDLANLIHSQIGNGSINSEQTRKSTDEKFSPTTFPPKVNGWNARFEFEEYLRMYKP